MKQETKDWNIIFKVLFPIAYIKWLGIILNEKM